MFEECKNKPNHFFIAAHMDDLTNEMINWITKVNSTNLSDYFFSIQNISLKNPGNLFLSPSLYKHIEMTGELLQLKNFVNGLVITGEYQGFNLINV